MEILAKEVADAIKTVFNLDVNCKIDTEYAFYEDDNVLTFPPYFFDEEENISYRWREWIQHIFNIEFEFWVTIPLSFLHELGHKITLKHITNEEYEKAGKVENEFQYYSTKREYVATAWAIRVCLHHPDLVDEFCTKLDKAFQEFYARNDIQNELGTLN